VIDEGELKERIVMAVAELRLVKASPCATKNPDCMECRMKAQFCEMSVRDAVANLAAFRSGLL